MGICVDLLEEQDLIAGVEDVIFVDLDRDQIHVLQDDSHSNDSPPIPEHHRKKLLSRLRKCCSIYDPDHLVEVDQLLVTTSANQN